jgi:hypothetical protein
MQAILGFLEEQFVNFKVPPPPASRLEVPFWAEYVARIQKKSHISPHYRAQTPARRTCPFY